MEARRSPIGTTAQVNKIIHHMDWLVCKLKVWVESHLLSKQTLQFAGVERMANCVTESAKSLQWFAPSMRLKQTYIGCTTNRQFQNQKLLTTNAYVSAVDNEKINVVRLRQTTLKFRISPVKFPLDKLGGTCDHTPLKFTISRDRRAQRLFLDATKVALGAVTRRFRVSPREKLDRFS
ncbi:hypothetical protein T265_06255 [Opisthorchis viverrini]|uniref:Uncharacterized protein n=1 Tax=Opisthorchis viverrini TaxID=6198 RepID=A0A074ZH52_OPIVI|nr:hypothetical protein T265_06255 [Opisthorchis viverrini]KER26538.1 hypothetical protein T265_06255 [Opisthorchis viverrini]